MIVQSKLRVSAYPCVASRSIKSRNEFKRSILCLLAFHRTSSTIIRCSYSLNKLVHLLILEAKGAFTRTCWRGGGLMRNYLPSKKLRGPLLAALNNFRVPLLVFLKFETPPSYLIGTNQYTMKKSEERLKQLKAKIQKRLQRA